MAINFKVINDVTPDESLFWKIEPNLSITLQEGKPYINHIKASLFNNQFLKTSMTIKLIKRRMKKEVLNPLYPLIYCNLVFVRQDKLPRC